MTIFDWLNQINYEKKSWDKFSQDEQKKFSTFIINRWLSMDENLIQVVNYFQKYSIGLLEPRDTYKWYCNIIPKQKRFNKYIKRPFKKEFQRLKKLDLTPEEHFKFLEICQKYKIKPMTTIFTRNRINLIKKMNVSILILDLY